MALDNELVYGHAHHNANMALTLEAYWATGAPLLEADSTSLVNHTLEEGQHMA